MSKLQNNFFIFFTTIFILSVGWNISYPSNVLIYLSMMPLVIFFSINPFPIAKQTVHILLFAFFIYLFFGLINITLYDNINYTKIDTYMKKMGNILVVFTFVILFFKDREEQLFKSIEYVLAIIVGLWIMQLVIYYATGTYIDLLEPISGRPQRYQAYFIQSELPIDLIRPTSIYIEPGTYAVNTLPFLALSYIRRNQLTTLHIITVLTYFFSLSLFGIVIGALFLFIVGIHKFKFQLNKRNIIFLLIIFVVVYGIQEYLAFRFIQEGNTGALDIRDSAIGYWQNLSGEEILLGQGNGNTIFYKSSIVDDSSFLFKLIFEYGVFAIPFIAFMFVITWGLPALFLLIILITKLHYLIHVLWFYLAGVYLHKTDEKKEEI